MKGENKKRRLLAEKRANRRAIIQVVVAVTVGPGLLIWFLVSVPRTGAPDQMVRAQLDRGNRAIQQSRTTENQPLAADSNSLKSFQNFVPEVVVSSGKKYTSVPFAELASFPFTVTPDIADDTRSPGSTNGNEDQQIPKMIKSLDGQFAAITGFMLPIDISGGVTTNFMLLRNQSACCYGIAPSINEWVIVHTNRKGVKPLMDVPITALGTLHVGDIRDSGQLLGIYQLNCDEIEYDKR